MSRLPIRWRVTLAFSAAMAIVLIAVGLFLYLRLEAQLDESIDNGLRSRAGEVSALAAAANRGLGASHDAELIEPDESFAQVLTPAGLLLDSTPQLRGKAVLSRADLARARGGAVFLERQGVPGIETTARLLAAPVRTPSGEVVVVVGSSLGDRDEALASLAALLAIGLPVALLLASLAGFWTAGRALRPVDAMRRRAAQISASAPGERLPVPRPNDELRRLGLTMNAMLGRLEAALERERRFVDDASHELRTPLALHKTNLELALRHDSEAELRAAIAVSLVEVDRLAQLAEDLLVVARFGDDGLAIAIEPLAVAELLDGVGARFAARADASGRGLRIEPAGDLVVSADRPRLEQALTNLLDNALRHGEGEVRLWAEGAEESVRLNVGDRGAGLPPEFAPHAFERFTRADPARGSGGSGLGLAIVETIAGAHGGRAGIDGRGGETVAWIELPRVSSPFHRTSVEPGRSKVPDKEET